MIFETNDERTTERLLDVLKDRQVKVELDYKQFDIGYVTEYGDGMLRLRPFLALRNGTRWSIPYEDINKIEVL